MTESNRGGDAVHATFDKEVAVADDVLPIQVESNGGTVHVRISVIGGGGAVRDQPGGGFDVAKVDEGGDDVPVPDDEGALADAEVPLRVKRSMVAVVLNASRLTKKLRFVSKLMREQT